LFISWVIVFAVPHVIDTVRAYNFQASSKIVAIDERLELTDRGTDIFYASQPQINEKEAFNENCETQERTTAILGCFYRDKIYLYDLRNTELDGTLEVTAAHEMLHAAYQRLTILERWYVDRMVVNAYEKVKDEKTIKELMAYYAESEPGAEVDELHSILGTVIADLDPELENYYKRYFEDRAVVVALNERYNAVFERLSEESKVIEARLAETEPEITLLLAQYNADREQIEADVQSFNTRATANQFASQAAFNAERSRLLSRIDELNQRRDEINARVAQYNADVAALNKLAVHSSELYQSMNGVDVAQELSY
jgi:predicted  nucleic acid-binding Zn-ribbon protein